MDIKDALATFGSKADLARAFGVSQPAVSRWVRKGVLPEKQVMRLQLGLVTAPKPVDARIRRKQLQVEAARKWAEKG